MPSSTLPPKKKKKKIVSKNSILFLFSSKIVDPVLDHIIKQFKISLVSVFMTMHKGINKN